jgi:hypothetical protein
MDVKDQAKRQVVGGVDTHKDLHVSPDLRNRCSGRMGGTNQDRFGC